MSAARINGVHFIDLLQSSRFAPANIDKNTPMETQSTCPACEHTLTTFCSLKTKGSLFSIRVGVCEECGYKGFIDRPSRDWMVTFYATDWDKEFRRSKTEMLQEANLPTQGIKASRYHALNVYKNLPINKTLPLCDIGCGYGPILKNFEKEGFKKLFGVENSQHRAELVQNVFGYTVYTGDFGGKKIQDNLKQQAPFGTLFSHHVFEHVYDPAKVVQAMSELQNEGGCLILALPNDAGEHINFRPFYLPHLHGFTKESLEKLLNRFGYEIRVDASPDETNTIIGAVKVTHPKAMFSTQVQYLKTAKDRLRKALCLDELTSEKPYTIYWEQRLGNLDYAQLDLTPSPLFVWRMQDCIAYIKSRLFKRFTAGYTMRLTGLPPSSISDPITIEFSPKIKLFIK